MAETRATTAPTTPARIGHAQPSRRGYFFSWAVRLSSVLVQAWIFYRLVERPAHLLARRIGGAALQPRLAGSAQLAPESSPSVPPTT